MMNILQAIENAGFSRWVVESSSVFAFPSILLLHTIGMGIIVGISAGIDLRILGYAPAMPLAPLERLLPMFWVSFWVNAVTGVIMLASDATTKMINPDFYIKMIFVFLAVINLQIIRKRVFRDPLIDKAPFSMNSKMLAVMN